MNRNQYQAARRGYRLARREDIQWRAPDGRSYDLRQANDPRFQHPENGLRYLRKFPRALADSFLRPLVDANRSPLRLTKGPRALALCGRDASGLDLAKRVALRAARRLIAERWAA